MFYIPQFLVFTAILLLSACKKESDEIPLPLPEDELSTKSILFRIRDMDGHDIDFFYQNNQLIETKFSFDDPKSYMDQRYDYKVYRYFYGNKSISIRESTLHNQDTLEDLTEYLYQLDDSNRIIKRTSYYKGILNSSHRVFKYSNDGFYMEAYNVESLNSTETFHDTAKYTFNENGNVTRLQWSTYNWTLPGRYDFDVHYEYDDKLNPLKGKMISFYQDDFTKDASYFSNNNIIKSYTKEESQMVGIKYNHAGLPYLSEVKLRDGTTEQKSYKYR